jgi:hypothetical protein
MALALGSEIVDRADDPAGLDRFSDLRRVIRSVLRKEGA